MEPNASAQCRLCLKHSQLWYSLFVENIAGLIESFTLIKINNDTNLPSVCCGQCLQDVYFVQKIRSRIIASDKALRELKHENEKILDIDQDVQTVYLDKSEEEIAIPELEALKLTKSSPTEIVSVLPASVSQNADSPKKVAEEKEKPQRMECIECNFSFFVRKEYMQHMKKHNIVSVCKICGRQVLSCNYRRHLEVHKSSPKICELCGAVAKNSESLRGHMFYMHKSTAEQYKCKICDKFFRYKYKFKLHQVKAHGGDKTHICEVCGKAFFTARDVKRHVDMTHMKLRPYVCQYCHKGFSSSYARNTHVRQHTNERPFKCEICAEGFKQRVSLKTHMKSKHGFLPNTNHNLLETADLKSEFAEIIILKT